VPIPFTAVVLMERDTFVAYSPELDVSSCGSTAEGARRNLQTTVRLFLEECERMGTLDDVLLESGYSRSSSGEWIGPRMVATEAMAAPIG
jgi:predicted RNase H-like HicB family nuclease